MRSTTSLALRISNLSIGLALVFSACIVFPDSESDFPFQLLMIPQDLPIGWIRDGGEFPEIPDADTHRVFFTRSRDPNQEYILISHTLSVYSTEAMAKNVYIDWESDWFPTSNWIQPEGISLLPANALDQYKFACIVVSINENSIMSCGYLQQHSNLISLVLANIDDEAISISELENTLRRLDQRMHDYTMTK